MFTYLLTFYLASLLR